MQNYSYKSVLNAPEGPARARALTRLIKFEVRKARRLGIKVNHTKMRMALQTDIAAMQRTL